MKHACVLPAAVLLLTLTGCESAQQSAQAQEWEQRASANAQRYVQQKYGFSAEVTAAKADRSSTAFGLGSKPTSRVFVTMQHDGRDFTVLISGAEETSEGADSWQSEDIHAALGGLLDEKLPGICRLEVSPKQKSETGLAEPLYSVFYDGSALADVLRDGVQDFTAYYVEADLSDDSAFAFLNDLCGNSVAGNFISCRDAAAAKVPSGADHPVYCDSVRRYSGGSSTYTAYRRGQHGTLFWCTALPAAGEPVFADPEIPFYATAFAGNGVGMEAETDSAAYTLTADTEMTVTVCYPLSAVGHPDARSDKLRFACCTSDPHGHMKWEAGPAERVGDYFCADLQVGPESGSCTFGVLWDP